jgi:hypothetical protein
VERDESGTATGLTLDERAILSEFGYDARWTARVARRRGGPPRLARMVRLARAGRLPFRPLPPLRDPLPAARRPTAGPLVALGVLLAVAALMLAFTTGAVALLVPLTGRHAAGWSPAVPRWAAALLVLGPLTALDALARWRGPLALHGPEDGPGGLLPGLLGLRPVPLWARGPACLPLLTLVPLYAAQRAARVPAPAVLEFTAVLLLGLLALTTLATGGRLALAVLLAAWAGWAYAALRGPALPAALALLAVVLAVGAPGALLVGGRLRDLRTAG